MEDNMSDKVFRDLYDIALEHSGDKPPVAAKWFEENFGAADGFVDWLMDFRPTLFAAWQTGFYDE